MNFPRVFDTILDINGSVPLIAGRDGAPSDLRREPDSNRRERARRTARCGAQDPQHSARDPGCCFPGCTYQRYLDDHHVKHWAEGGATKLKNLVHLCRTHHRLVHEGGIGVRARAGGGWRFSRPDGREFDAADFVPAPQEWTALRDTHAALGIEIDSDTAATRWRGERMDYELGVWGLCQEHARAQHAPPQHERAPAE